MSIFPFTVRSHDNGHHIVKPWSYNATFVKYKPKDVSWYAYDVEVLSKTRVKITIYGMSDMCYGGIGIKTHEYECDVDASDLEDFINREIMSTAKYREELEFNARRLDRVSEIADEIRASIN